MVSSLGLLVGDGEGNKQGELAVASYFESRVHCNAEVTFGPDVRRPTVVVDKELLQLPHQKERSHLYNCKTLYPSSKHMYAFS